MSTPDGSPWGNRLMMFDLSHANVSGLMADLSTGKTFLKIDKESNGVAGIRLS
jgi:hypothetical protein